MIETVEEHRHEDSDDEMINRRMTIHEVKVQRMDNQTRIMELQS